MANALCASCKSRVEDGAVRCVSCGAQLFRPGVFTQVVGWVVVALSLIPFAIAEVTTAERDLTPLILGVVVLIAGIGMVVSGRARSKAAPPAVITETAAGPTAQP